LLRAAQRLDLSALDSALYLALPSLVPLQAILLVWLGISVVVDTSWLREISGLGGLPLGVLAAILGFSLLMPQLGVLVERKGFSLRDWVGFILLMVSWLPLALFGALTWGVRSWKPTPHGLGERPAMAEGASKESAPAGPSPALDVE
jgi:hypothetical protein